MLPRLFEPFAQADMSGERAAGGLGLGLPLAQIIEQHGGTITAHSDGVGNGSDVTDATSRTLTHLAPMNPCTRPRESVGHGSGEAAADAVVSFRTSSTAVCTCMPSALAVNPMVLRC